MSGKSVKLSELQLMVMKVLWRHKKLSVSETHQILNRQKEMAPTTVATLLKRMHEKEILNVEKEGRQFLYSPAISENDVKTSMLSSILDSLFDGSPTELVHHLVAQDEVNQNDLDRIKQLLSEGQISQNKSKQGKDNE
ncbi:MAG: BlaI/MecI/CopY family transcriptional regulator [Kangiellaceae bacterium]|nr:BlaI/MecI/CopY family transcriptional regulator [Kangiellaceae bacterium]